VADSECMQIGERSKALVYVKFDEEHRYGLFHLAIVFQNSIDGLWHVVHHNIQINLVLLLTLGVKGVSQRNDIGVEKLSHDLKFAVLVPLILIHFLDGHHFPGLRNRCLIRIQLDIN